MIAAGSRETLGGDVFGDQRVGSYIAVDGTVWQREECEIRSNQRVDRHGAGDQMALPGLRRRHRADGGNAKRLADALVVEKEEGFLALDGPAQCCPVLVFPKGRQRPAVKKVSRIEYVIAQELIQRSMKLVRPRAGHGVDHAAGGASILR